MSYELTNALTILVYVVITIVAFGFIVWVSAGIFAARRINKMTKNFDKRSAEFNEQFNRLRRS